MPEAPGNLNAVIFAKSAVGVQEIQTRSVGLQPLQRRLLILVDGKRNLAELSALVPGQDVAALLEQLISKSCIEAAAVAAVEPFKPVVAESMAPAKSATVSPFEEAFAALPPPESRSEKDINMARTFMVNTVNTMFAQYSKLTLVEAISACKTAEELRRIYVDWSQTMATSAIGTKRLPELTRQLFTTL